jgi:hypothetical protein
MNRTIPHRSSVSDLRYPNQLVTTMLLRHFLLGSLQLFFALQCNAIHRCESDTQPSENRIFVLTDISNEPDD